MFKKRDISKLLEIEPYVPKIVVYIKPYFEKKVLEAPILCGTAGSYDETGLYIPKRFFNPKVKKSQKPLPGCIVTPLRKSMKTGRRYANKLGITCGDTRLKLMATNPKHAKHCINLGLLPIERKIPKKMKQGLRKFRKLMRDTTGTSTCNRNYIKTYNENYMRIQGIVKIKKVLAPKRKSLNLDTIECGVVGAHNE